MYLYPASDLAQDSGRGGSGGESYVRLRMKVCLLKSDPCPGEPPGPDGNERRASYAFRLVHSWRMRLMVRCGRPRTMGSGCRSLDVRTSVRPLRQGGMTSYSDALTRMPSCTKARLSNMEMSDGPITNGRASDGAQDIAAQIPLSET